LGKRCVGRILMKSEQVHPAELGDEEYIKAQKQR